jgi:hypothetical protein
VTRIFLLLLLLCGACQSTQDQAKPIAPPDPPEQIVERSGPKPSWTARGTYLDPADRNRGYRFFTGLSTGQTDLVEAEESALLQARRSAADFICTHIKSEFSQLVRNKVVGGNVSFLEVINVDTQATVDSLIEGAERAGKPYWVRYSDGTLECHALIRVPEKNLDPIRSLLRAFRRKGAGATDREERLGYMENILTLSLHDLHAQFIKSRCLEQLGRTAEALLSYKTLWEWNEGPDLDLTRLYGDARLPVPAGCPATVDLESIVFRLTPHWKDLTARLVNVAEKRANGNMFVMRTNEAEFHLSQRKEGETPLMVTLSCPDNHERWCSFFWIDSEGLCQVNNDAPLPVRLSGPLRLAYSLENLPGEVILIGFASRDKDTVDFSKMNTAFTEGQISRDKIEREKDNAEILRMDYLVRLIERYDLEADSFVSALVRFTIKP